MRRPPAATPAATEPTVELPDVGLFGAMPQYGDLTMHAVVDVTRALSRDALEAATTATFAAFPVLAHRYRAGSLWDRWVPVPGKPTDALHVETTDDLEAATTHWTTRTLDAARDRQLRVVALTQGAHTRLIVTLTHLAADGAGFAAVGHVLGSHLAGHAPDLPTDTRRDLWTTINGLGWQHAPRLALGVLGALARPLRQLRAARRTRPYDVDALAPAASRQIVITEDELLGLRQRCRGASVNELLVAAAARAAAQRSRGGPVVVTFTMDLRRYGRSARLIAANVSSILTAVVPRDVLGSIAGAAAHVRRSSKRDLATLAGPAFLLSPYALGSAAPHALSRRIALLLTPVLVDLPLSRGLLLTNVGRLDAGLGAFARDVSAIRIVGPSITSVPAPIIVASGFRGALQLDLYAPAGLGAAALDSLERELLDALEISR